MTAVQAEADPAFAYSVGGHFLPYGGVHGVHAVHAVPAVHAVHAVHPPLVYTHTGCQNDAGAVVPCALGGVSVLGVAPVPAKEEAAPVEAVDRKKREADAEAEPEADADAKADADPYLFYSTHGYWPVGHIFERNFSFCSQILRSIYIG